MEIYVVKKGDTIETIAQKYGITVERLVLENGLSVVSNLVEGQALVITYPKLVHTVQSNETLESIADLYNVTTMQLLRNNPFLTTREVIADEVIVISYETRGEIATNGFCYSYISKNTLIRTLPNLTYLSVFNYTITKEGNIISYQDDSYVIKTAKEYNVIPLMLLTTLTPHGQQNMELDYQILLNEDLQEKNTDQFLQIIRDKGYQGINMVFYYLNEENQDLYINLVKRISNRLQQENFLFFITINYDVTINNGQTSIAKIDYSKFSDYINGFVFMRFVWGTNYAPPAPVSNINYIQALTEYILQNVPADKINIGNPVIGYDWNISSNRQNAYSLSISSVLGIAYETNSVIQFDEISQTPYFYYYEYYYNTEEQHIIWFVDARSLDALMKLIDEYDIYGNGVWNIMIYNAQLWTIINSNFDIIKLV
ncbi:LysM peptidoglycan-binding domain-containing protein [Konateibacter massiliensis]|uniref:LysM peptidoglycan-binding domain-containing protein n=1 Tax=Konateibacter massiliensis TaxID=2002841 RepID=UPI000C15D6FD|nr:LysM peptidoglycan-binding domain-containing protein [Konateibacter massiliensis]